MQVRQVVTYPEHVAHGDSQGKQDDPEVTVTPLGQEAAQEEPERKNKGKQVTQVVTVLEQVAQFEVQA